jgi:hypothetical protein
MQYAVPPGSRASAVSLASAHPAQVARFEQRDAVVTVTLSRMLQVGADRPLVVRVDLI